MLLSEAMNQDYDKVLQNAGEVQNILNQRARKLLEEAESGRATTPNVEVKVGFKPQSYENVADSLLFLGVARECILENKFNIINLNEAIRSKFKLRQYAQGGKKKQLVGRQGTHNREHGNIAVTKMPEEAVSDLREKYPVLKPVFDQLVMNNGGLPSILSHELTHACIHRNIGSVSGQRSPKIDEIDEAAAQLTGELMGKPGSDPLEYEDMDREKLHLVEKLLNDKAQEATGVDQKIDIVREEAAKAAKKIQRHPGFDIIQALYPKRVEFANKFSKAIREMEGVEKESVQVLEALGLMEGDLQGKQREKYYITQLENEKNEVVKDIFPSNVETDTVDDEVDKLFEGEETTHSKGSNSGSRASGGPNKSLKSLSAAADQLEKLAANDDLTTEEVHQLAESIDKINAMLEAFQEKREKLKERYSIPEKIVNGRRKTSQDELSPNEACEDISEFLELYLNLINGGIKLCEIGIEGLEQLHDSEAKSAELMKRYGEESEYHKIQEAEQDTEEAYSHLKKSKRILEDSKGNIQRVNEDLEQAKKILAT